MQMYLEIMHKRDKIMYINDEQHKPQNKFRLSTSHTGFYLIIAIGPVKDVPPDADRIYSFIIIY